MKESTRDEFFTLAEEKRRVTTDLLWRTLAEKLSTSESADTLTEDEKDALEHEALKKIAYLKESRQRPDRNRESATIKLRMLEKAYQDLFGELPK